MADLHIKVSSPSAKPASSKPSANNDAAQQDAQEFGNVLARQVADTAKPAETTPRSAGDKAKQAEETDSMDTSRADASGDSLPADMLAALLGQQNSVAPALPDILAQSTAQTLANAQALANSPLQPDAKLQSVMDAQAAAGFTAIPGALPSGKTNSANLAMLEADSTALHSGNTNQEIKGFADKFKTSVMGEISTASGKQVSLGAGVISELASTMQQPAMMPLLAGATANASPLSINAAVTQPAWGDEFSQQITWMATQRNQSAELHLNPPQLGPLDVVLKMNGDQATAMFTSPHAAVREAIEQAIPKLREMMAESGIMLGNAMVSDHSAKNNQDNSPRKAQGRSLTSAEAKQGSGIQETRVSPIRQHNGMVDTFA